MRLIQRALMKVIRNLKLMAFNCVASDVVLNPMQHDNPSCICPLAIEIRFPSFVAAANPEADILTAHRRYTFGGTFSGTLSVLKSCF